MGKINTLLFYLSKLFRIKGYGISILVPFHIEDKTDQRAINWNWLIKYWNHSLPGAEIIIGRDKEAEDNSKSFSKSIAVNNAVSRAHGDIFVIIDADAYLEAESIIKCSNEIRLAKKKGYKLWFVPYRKLFRLTKEVSNKILKSASKTPYIIPNPPLEKDFSNTGDFKGTPVSQIGHWYGAMIQIMSKEAFNFVGGWDQRFSGWGGEDHAAMVAMDTLYSPHKTIPGQVLHLWHPIMTPEGVEDNKGKLRMWANQTKPGTNNSLSGRYYYSRNNPKRMRSLVDEWKSGSIIKSVDNNGVSSL
jgi:hypothetical protein